MRTLFAFIIAFVLLFPSMVFADTLTLTQIGTMETKGKKYNQWWYEPQNVVLKGMGSKGANIDVTVDGAFNTIHASVADGSWTYDMGTLNAADHHISIGSGNETYSFILTIGSSPPADMLAGNGTLPQTGGLLPLIGMAGFSLALIYIGLRKTKA